jgi:hypothetical protein
MARNTPPALTPADDLQRRLKRTASEDGAQTTKCLVSAGTATQLANSPLHLGFLHLHPPIFLLCPLQIDRSVLHATR